MYLIRHLDEREFLDMSALMLAGTPEEQLRGTTCQTFASALGLLRFQSHRTQKTADSNHPFFMY
jgi:hypothetical protein